MGGRGEGREKIPLNGSVRGRKGPVQQPSKEEEEERYKGRDSPENKRISASSATKSVSQEN